jgi:hypothetical protein
MPIAGERGVSFGDGMEGWETHTAPKEEGSTTPFVDCVETGEGGRCVHGAGDHAYDESIRDSRVLEILSPVVKYEVDTGKLLQSLKATSSELSLKQAAPEAVEV